MLQVRDSPRSHIEQAFSLASFRGWRRSLALILPVLVGACSGGGPKPPSATSTAAGPAGQEAAIQTAVRDFYVGLAALQVGDFERAEARFREVTALVPAEPASWANLSLLALRRGDQAEAREAIERARTLDPAWPPAAYLDGAIALAAGNAAAAVEPLRTAAAADPANLAARHLLARALETSGAPISDTLGLTLALADDAPANAAANLAAVRAAAEAGDQPAAARAARRIAGLAQSWPEHLIPLALQLSEAADGGELALTAERATLLATTAMSAPSYRADLRVLEPSPGEIAYPAGVPAHLPTPSDEPAPPDTATTYDPRAADVGDGAWSWAGLFYSGATTEPRAMVASGAVVRPLGPDGPTVPFPSGPNATPPGPDGVLAVDLDGDFALDLVLAGKGGLRIYRATDGGFEDVTGVSGLGPELTDSALEAAWAADLESDGDLDLVVAPPDAAPLGVRNNGDGTFTAMDTFTGPPGAVDMVWADLDGDALPEAVFLGPEGELVPYANARSGTFLALPAPHAVPSVAITAADVDGDGRLDLVVLGRDGSLISASDPVGTNWSISGQGPNWEASALGAWPTVSGMDGAVRLIAADLDNNGAEDLVASGIQDGQIWLSDGERYSPLPQGLALGGIAAAAELSGDGRLDLVALDESGHVQTLEGRGGREYHWKSFRPRARVDAGDGRVNSFGLGGQFEVRSGRLVQTAPIAAPIVHFGLGTNPAMDVARVVWPNGTIQAEFDQPADAVDVAATTFEQRLEGSCPYVFAVGPDGPRFITDFLWRSPLGMRVNAQQTAGIETTQDWVMIPGDALANVGGAYELRITADLWETHFFDTVRLIVVDHPVGSEAWVDERFAVPAPPLTVTLTTAIAPLHARDDLGTDVSRLVAARDGEYLDSFGRGRLQGVTRDHFMELELDDAARASGEVVMIAVGWIQPTDSSLNVALAQGSGPPPEGLRLETRQSDGSFTVAATGLGFPEGKNKTVVLGLDRLLAQQPADAATGRGLAGRRPGRVRLATNLEVYWDQVAWAEVWSGPGPQLQELVPKEALLRYRGFSAKVAAGPTSPELPVYERLVGTVQRRRDLEGFYTRFGDVRDLLAAVDDRLVIMNAGDEIVLRFAAPPGPSEGWRRDFVLEGDGWVKDGNHNTQHSRTVLPMPAHGQAYSESAPLQPADDPMVRTHIEDWTRFHTRYVGTEPVREALRGAIR